jgi:hypothetical protein
VASNSVTRPVKPASTAAEPSSGNRSPSSSKKPGKHSYSPVAMARGVSEPSTRSSVARSRLSLLKQYQYNSNSKSIGMSDGATTPPVAESEAGTGTGTGSGGDSLDVYILPLRSVNRQADTVTSQIPGTKRRRASLPSFGSASSTVTVPAGTKKR